jgi:hypothetical protein
VAHASQKNSKFFFQKYNKSVRVSLRAYIDTLSIFMMRAREVHFVFIFMIANFMLVWNHSKSCTPSCDWGQLTNRYRKTKVGAYNDKVPWGCRRFQSWKGSATRIPCWSNRGLWQVLPMEIKLSILRPGLVNQSQENLNFSYFATAAQCGSVHMFGLWRAAFGICALWHGHYMAL